VQPEFGNGTGMRPATFNCRIIGPKDHMPFNPPEGTPQRGQQALSPHSPWVAGPPDILLMVLASLSLWALIVWALARYL
jgi:hypothetical protein